MRGWAPASASVRGPRSGRLPPDDGRITFLVSAGCCHAPCCLFAACLATAPLRTLRVGVPTESSPVLQSSKNICWMNTRMNERMSPHEGWAVVGVLRTQRWRRWDLVLRELMICGQNTGWGGGRVHRRNEDCRGQRAGPKSRKPPPFQSKGHQPIQQPPDDAQDGEPSEGILVSGLEGAGAHTCTPCRAHEEGNGMLDDKEA